MQLLKQLVVHAFLFNLAQPMLHALLLLLLLLPVWAQPGTPVPSSVLPCLEVLACVSTTTLM
jgi:hypothetical protein